MEFHNQFEIAATRATLWPVLMDVHQVAACIEGVEALEVIDNDHFKGILRVGMGPVKLAFAGAVEVQERDSANWQATLAATGKDAKAGGGFEATLTMQLLPRTEDEDATLLEVTLATGFLGRVGQLGRPLIKKKINTMLGQFAENLRAQMATTTSEP